MQVGIARASTRISKPVSAMYYDIVYTEICLSLFSLPFLPATKTAASVLPATAVQSAPAKPVPTLPLASVTQDKYSQAQPDLPSDPDQPSVSSESTGVVGAPGHAFSVSNSQTSHSSLKQLLLTLDASSLQKVSLSEAQTLKVLVLNNNPSPANTPSLESIAPNSNPQTPSAVIQYVSNEPSTVLAEMAAPTIAAVPSEPQVSTSGTLTSPCQDLLPMQLNTTSTIEHSIPQVNLENISEDFPQPRTPVQPGMAETSSDLKSDANMQKETGLPNPVPDIVASPLFASDNLCDNCKAVRSGIRQLVSQSSVVLPEDTKPAGNGFTPSDSATPSTAGKFEAELSKQRSSRSDLMRRAVDRAIELYHSTHPAPQRSATSTDVYASTDNYYTLDSCNGIGNIRMMVDLRSLAVTGCVQKSTIYVDMGHLNFRTPFMNPTHPRANITLAELNQEPAASLDPHHSGTAPYYTSCLLDDMDGIPHSDSFTRAIAPVYHDWNCWNNPEYAARMLQQDLDEVRHEEHDLIISIPLTNATPKSASKRNKRKVPQGKRRSRKKMLEDRDDIGGGPGAGRIQLKKKKKKKKYIPAMFAVFTNSDESEADQD